MSHHGIAHTSRAAELLDKAAGYPSEAVRLGDGLPSGVFTLRAVEPRRTDEGEFLPVTAEIEAVMQRGALRLTGQERAELEQALSSARTMPPPSAAARVKEAENDRPTPRNR